MELIHLQLIIYLIATIILLYYCRNGIPKYTKIGGNILFKILKFLVESWNDNSGYKRKPSRKRPPNPKGQGGWDDTTTIQRRPKPTNNPPTERPK